MGTLNRRNATRCNVGAVIFTMFLGICFSVASADVLTVGFHVASAIANPQVASPSLVVELMLSTLGGLFFGVGGAMGASIALLLADPRLRRSRLAQATIAAIGATLAGLAVFMFLVQSASIDFGSAPGVLALVAVSTFALMCIRAKAHTVSPSRPLGS